jgi:hypothetical protein
MLVDPEFTGGCRECQLTGALFDESSPNPLAKEPGHEVRGKRSDLLT